MTAAEPAIASEPYQQILAVFDTGHGAMRAKDLCQALGIGAARKTPKASEPS